MDTEGNIEKVFNQPLDWSPKVIVLVDEIFFTSLHLHSFYEGKLFRLSNGVIHQVSNTNPNGNDQITEMIVFKNELYFRTLNENGLFKLFKYGQNKKVYQVSNINNGNNDYIFNFKEFNGDLYWNGQSNREIFKLSVD